MLRMMVLVCLLLLPALAAEAEPVAVELLTPDRPAAFGPGPAEGPLLPPSTYDTLRWHDYTVSSYCHSGPTSGDAWLFGLGAKLTPNQYPAVIVGLSSRVYRDPQSPTRGAMQIRICDDDGAGGDPGTIMYFDDTQADTWAWYFPYYRMPYPYDDTIWDGSFYLFYLSRDTGWVEYTILWAYDLALNYLEEHWWHQHGEYHVCTNITADLSMGAVVEYPATGAEEPGPGARGPRGVTLGPAEPNPFRGATRIRYGLPKECRVSLGVYDAAGNRVRNFDATDNSPGFHEKTWDGRNDAGREVGAGMYFLRLEAGGAVRTGKLVRRD